ncbi:DUF3472 domain-containing protein [Pedobacter frigoris]|uniref:DUF3472 domain-containing protein n=1 Tax=Pedobacter frigoris TaxID=2571272 RepID=A0A4U1CPP8_9SPHI|nr:DUF3472 domain-containing protein [Pedobacter frigoris]
MKPLSARKADDFFGNPSASFEEDLVRLATKGTEVQANSFGNEGTGGQSYRKYNWKTGILTDSILLLRILAMETDSCCAKPNTIICLERKLMATGNF